MKIGIILHPYGEHEPAGLGRAIFELTRAMIAYDMNHEYIIFTKEKPRVRPRFPGNNWRIEVLGGVFLWLERLRKANQCDIYVFNTPVMPLFWKPKKSIVIALDFAYLYAAPRSVKEFLTRLVLRRYHTFSLKKSSVIAAISDATKKDVIRFFRISEEKIKTVCLGFNRICDVREEIYQLPEKFFLFVGVMKERKNVFRIVRAFREFLARHPDYHLVLIGKTGGSYYEIIARYIKQEGIGNFIHFVGYLAEGHLSYAYRRATALVFPSIIEGFGFPVLEAMNCGLPVITSRSSSLPELAGDGALLVDPHRVEEIAAAMERVTSDENFRKELSRRGILQAQSFSWEKTAEKFVSIINGLL